MIFSANLQKVIFNVKTLVVKWNGYFALDPCRLGRDSAKLKKTRDNEIVRNDEKWELWGGFIAAPGCCSRSLLIRCCEVLSSFPGRCCSLSGWLTKGQLPVFFRFAVLFRAVLVRILVRQTYTVFWEPCFASWPASNLEICHDCHTLNQIEFQSAPQLKARAWSEETSPRFTLCVTRRLDN